MKISSFYRLVVALFRTRFASMYCLWLKDRIEDLLVDANLAENWDSTISSADLFQHLFIIGILLDEEKTTCFLLLFLTILWQMWLIRLLIRRQKKKEAERAKHTPSRENKCTDPIIEGRSTRIREKQENAASRIWTYAWRSHWISSPTP